MKLLTLLLLLGVASPAVTEVVVSFKQTCSEFFIRDPNDQNKGIPPTVLKGDQYKQICQRWEDQYRFATLYNTQRRIPVYSAYTFYPAKRTQGYLWKIEPQLDEAPTEANREMKEMPPKEEEKLLFFNQALNKDYNGISEGCYYSKGHVCPNSYAMDLGQAESTFTLTNAAPQKQDSNEEWAKQVEEPMKAEIQRVCGPTADRPAYVVTGVVPGETWLKMERGEKDIPEGVNIPRYYWTAYSCKDNNERVHSNAFIAQQITCRRDGNTPFEKKMKSVEELDRELRDYYNQEFHVFPIN